jgi:hypothetical protein
MRRWPALLAAVLIVLFGYAAWPLLGLLALANSIEQRDTRTFLLLVDIPHIKRSLATQLVRAHLKATGKDKRMSPLAIDLAVRAGIAVADSYIVEIVKPAALMDLLRQGRVETLGSGSTALPTIGWPNLRSARRLLAAEYHGRDFYIMVPLSASANDSFRLHLRLLQWQWKLAGIKLPEAIAIRIEREIRATQGPG